MPNRLAASSSPYLRQHAENSVDWREWGEEAFAERRECDLCEEFSPARTSDVPRFVPSGTSVAAASEPSGDPCPSPYARPRR